MDEIISDFKAVTLTKMQKVLAILALVLVIMANTNVKPSDYSAYVQNGSVSDLYFMTVFKSGDAVSLGVLGQFVRVK